MSKISVIVPVYNVEKYLNRCVDSILAQTFTDFELILVDDGSPDNCGKICDEYAEKDNRIHVIHKENGGLSDARNAGIDWAFEHSNSEWITFIDSDDWIHPKYLEYMYGAVIKTGCRISACDYYETTGEEKGILREYVEYKTIKPEDFYCNYRMIPTIACCKLYNKECFNNIRFPVGLLHEDVFVTYKLLFMYDCIALIDERLYAYFQSPESIMRKEWNPARLVVFDGYYEQLGFFEKNGYNKALKKAINNISYVFCQHIEKIGFNHSCAKYKTKLKKMLRKHLRKHKNDGGFSLQETPYFYENAYPIFMRYYWYWQAVKRKFKRK